MFDKLSISNQLRWGILLLVMLCLLMSGSLLLYLSQQQQLQQAGRLQNAQAAAVARQIGLYAVDLTAKLKYVAKIQSLLQFPIETQTALLTALYQHHEAYDSVALFNRQGEIILSVGAFDAYLTKDLVPHSTLHQFLMDGEKSNKNSLFLPIEMQQETSQLISYFAVIVNDSLNKIDGLLVVRFNLDFLNFIVSQLNIGQHGYAYILDREHRLIAYKDRLAEQIADIKLLDSFENKSFLPHLKQSTRHDLLRYRGLTGDKVVGAIAEVPLMAWQVVTELPEREVQLELYTLFISMLLSLIVAIIFAVLLSLRFIRHLIRPLNTLTQAASRISDGNLNIRVRINAKHEMGILAHTFNQMVTQLQTLFEQLEENIARANHANQAKSTFLANVSHELRTPLNAVLGYAQILLKDPQLTEQQRNGLEVILHNGRYLLTLISDILDFSKIESGRLQLLEQDFNLPNVLKNLTVLFKDRAESKGLIFHDQISDQLPQAVFGDERRLRQILSHLLSNAVKFTSEGEIYFRVQAENYHIRFDIIDTGIGIAAEDIATILQPFQQMSDINNKSAGTGLGLAMSYRLIQMMGGELQVESRVAQGSRFYFTLPLKPALDAASVAHDVEEMPLPKMPMSEPALDSREESEPLPLTSEDAEQLYDAVNMGDITGILSQIEALAQRDSRLQDFADRVRALAQAFDEEAICRLIEPYR
ncbi:sensor histidine kinase [Thioflexithrix psekupsensis]|uniref:histidine kinase n=1 Tax=Thioflexithrix psekupsensis TaxID=1570016 RepID=A0A251X8S3_9GAMM|nr:hybrid sensor histidine kinase/response regulator [Thioflexithrix psekupsensis]OUD13932.1 hypothetical protein TPSD3_06200 [Thioflexithrix psekupsensis]